VPFRVPDDAVIVEAPPGRVRRLLRRPSDRYSPWRRWLLHINRAVALEIHTHVVLPAPPPGSRAIPTRFVVFVCRTCGAWNLGFEEIVHLRTRCEGRSDLSHIDAVTAQAVKRETL